MHVRKATCRQLSDPEIVRKSLEQIDYFACLYERYEARLLRYVQRLTRATPAEAADILQESFIRVWMHLPTYDPRRPLERWLYRIVHNQAISFVRHKHARGRDRQVAFDEQWVQESPGEPPPQEIAARRERRDALVHAVLGQLPAPYREVLVLRFLKNNSYDEIAGTLHLPGGTVAVRLNRAKKAFARQLAVNGGVGDG